MGAVLVSTVWKKNRLDDRVDGFLHHNNFTAVYQHQESNAYKRHIARII